MATPIPLPHRPPAASDPNDLVGELRDLVGALGPSAAALPGHAVTSVETAAVGVRASVAAFNGHDLDTLVAAFTPDARLVTGHRGPPVEGSHGVRLYLADQFAHYLGIALDVRSCACTRAPNEAAVQCEVVWHARWHDRDSGHTIGRDGCATFRFEGDKIAELHLTGPTDLIPIAGRTPPGPLDFPSGPDQLAH